MTFATIEPTIHRVLPRGQTLRRMAFYAMLLGAVAWGAHRHDTALIASDLSQASIDRSYVIDASTGTLDLSNVAAQPGEVVQFVLAGSAGSPHAFILTGATPGAEVDQTTDVNGDTVIRMRVPEDGALSFICTIPGHEGLHGTLIAAPH